MKKLLALILAAVLVMALAACGATGTPKSTPANGDAAETAALLTFTVTVIHADGSQKEFTYETAEKYVGPVLVEAGLIEGNDGPYGLEITKVDGEKAVYATDGAYWAIYEGSQYAASGIDNIKIVDGGSYTLKYEMG